MCRMIGGSRFSLGGERETLTPTCPFGRVGCEVERLAVKCGIGVPM